MVNIKGKAIAYARREREDEDWLVGRRPRTTVVTSVTFAPVGGALLYSALALIPLSAPGS
jgi:hypothetical protein